MYLIIYVALLLIIFQLNKKINHGYFSFVTIFSSLWFLFAALSSLGLYHIRKPSLVVHLYVIIFVLIVDALFFFQKKITIKAPVISTDVSYTLKVNRIFMIQLLAILLSLPLLTQAITLYSQFGDLSIIRTKFFSSSLFESYIAGVVFKGAPMGLLNALIIIWSVYAFENKQYKYIFWSIVDCLLITLINGGRGAVFDLMIVLLMLFLYIDRDKLIVSKIFKRIIFVILIGAFVFMIVVSINRGQNIIKSIYLYFSGSFAFLDYILENAEIFALNNHQYGYISLSFLIEPLILIMKYVGWTTIKIPSWHFNNYCQYYYNIGTGGYNVMINNNTTFFFCFLKDLGTIGIVLAALIFGCVISQLFKQWKHGNTKSGLFFLYFCTVLISGIMSYKLLGTSFFFLVCAIVFCCKNRRR